MKKFTAYRNDLILVAAIVIVVIGFRLVTQADQGGLVLQNDGYAVSGGLLIVIAGALFGYWLSNWGKR